MSTDKKVPAEAALRQYEALVATAPGVERRGATMPYTSLNGHMFSFLTPEGTVALRLPEKEREAFLERYQTTLWEQHGRVMQEYKIPGRGDNPEWLIGQSLYEIYSKILQTDEPERIHEAIRVFRRHYAEIGLESICLFPGVDDLLAKIVDAGRCLAIASLKAERFVPRFILMKATSM